MAIETLDPPAVEPVTLAQAKARLRVDHSDEDDLISDLIAAARGRFERIAGVALITRRIRERLDDWRSPRRLSSCGRAFALGLAPVSSVVSVTTYDRDGAAEIWDAADYRLDVAGIRPRLALVADAAWPAPGRVVGGLAIEYDAGFGADPSAVPADMREALLAMIGGNYEKREAYEREEGAAIAALIAPFVRGRL